MKFRKKPVVIEAVHFNGYNSVEVAVFMEMAPVKTDVIMIDTLEGMMKVSVGDWVIKGVNGEFYPCKPDIFEKSYEPVEDV